MSDIAESILKRILDKEMFYVHLSGKELCLDGWLSLNEEEAVYLRTLGDLND